MSGKQAAVSNENWNRMHKRSSSPKKRSTSPKKHASRTAKKEIDIHEYMDNLTGIRSDHARVFRNANQFVKTWTSAKTAKNKTNMTKQMRTLRRSLNQSRRAEKRFHNKYGNGTGVQYRKNTWNRYLAESAIPHNTEQFLVGRHMAKSKMQDARHAYSKGMTGLDPVME